MMFPRAFNSAKPSSETLPLAEGHCQILNIDRTCETYPGAFWVVDVAILLGEVKGGGFETEDDIVEQRGCGYHGVWRDGPRPSNAAAGHGVRVIGPGSLRRSFVSFAHWQVKALEIYILPFSSHSLLAHSAHCTGPFISTEPSISSPPIKPPPVQALELVELQYMCNHLSSGAIQ